MPGDFSGLFESMQTYNPALDRLKEDLRKSAVPNVKIEHPANKTNELLEEQNHKIDELQMSLDAANIQITTLHDTIKENEAIYQQEQHKASVAARRNNRIAIAISVISIIATILSVTFAEELVEVKHDFYNVTDSWRPNKENTEPESTQPANGQSK